MAAKKKKEYGPMISEGIKVIVSPPRKSSLNKLKEEFKGDARKVETFLMISPLDFKGRDKGEEFLMERAAAWEGRCVPFVTIRDIDSLKTEKILALKKKLSDEEASLEETVKKTDVSSFKAKLVTCPECESKVNKNYVKNSLCPVCGKDLRSKTTVKTIEGKKAKIKRAKTLLRNELVKNADKAPLKYLVVMPKE